MLVDSKATEQPAARSAAHHALLHPLALGHARSQVPAAVSTRGHVGGQGFIAGGVLQGIETIVEDALHVDPEWHRLGRLPGVQEGWAELKVKAAAAISECQARPRRHPPEAPHAFTMRAKFATLTVRAHALMG